MLKKIFLVAPLLILTTLAYCSGLENAKIYLLNGNYKEAISEGERLMAKSAHSKADDELYYILGLSYLKDGNLLRSSDIFEIILNESKDSRFKEEATMGLGDTYLLRGDFQKAQELYEGLINRYPNTKFKAQAYFRLSQAAFQKGESNQGKEYSDKLKSEFPLSAELKIDADLPVIQDAPSGIYYTVQVGSFSNSRNANNLAQILKKKGYDAFVQEFSSSGQISYKVRVGKLALRREALDLEKRLAQEGYPTQIFP